MKILVIVIFVLVCVVLLNRSSRAESSSKEKMPSDVYAFTVRTIDGEEKNLSDYKGKVLLFVNTASRCGFTPQYKNLEKLYEEYKDKGLVVLGFPANNFMNQEPGSNADIKTFCELKYKTTFPMFSKISVKGDDIDPLYAFLTNQPGFTGPIGWNFNKILVGPDGKVVARFESKVDPLSKELTQTIDNYLK